MRNALAGHVIGQNPPAESLTAPEIGIANVGVSRPNNAAIPAAVKAATRATGKSVYIAWASFQRRQVSMVPYCGFETVFLPVQRPINRIRKGWAYFRNAFATMEILRRQRPEVVWMQLPQVPLMWVALLYRFWAHRKPILVADCHNAMFRAPWSKVPLGVGLLAKCDIVIAHTDEMRAIAISLRVPANKLLVVGDPPADIATVDAPALTISRPWIVFPASFSEDEPIAEVIQAARLVPGISVLITGDYISLDKLKLHATAPPNVSFLGFLNRADFDSLIQHCDAVMAFTRLDGLQMSVCGEAVGCAKPMLISNTQALRRLFPIGGVFVNSADPQAIADGLRKLFDNHAALSAQAQALNAQSRSTWANVHAKMLAERIDAVRADADAAGCV